MQIRSLRALAMDERLLEQLMLALFAAPHGFEMMRERLLRLRLLAMKARQILGQPARSVAQSLDARLGRSVRAEFQAGRYRRAMPCTTSSSCAVSATIASCANGDRARGSPVARPALRVVPGRR